MKVIVGFLGGIAVGMWAVILLTDGPHLGQVLSERTSTEIQVAFPDNNPPLPSPGPDIAEISDTPTLTPLPKPTNTPTPKPTKSPSPTPTPLPKPVQPNYSSAELNGFVDRFAGQYGVDPNVLRAIAICESGFDASRVSRNGLYLGLYQFSSGAWKTYRGQIGEDPDPGLRLNGEEAIQTAAYVVSVGRGSIWPNCMP